MRKGIFVTACVICLYSFSSTASSEGLPSASMYDPLTRTTTHWQQNADGSRDITVRDESGKIIDQKTITVEEDRHVRARSYDPDTKEFTTSEYDPFSGGHRVRKTDEDGNLLSDEYEHYPVSSKKALWRLESHRDILKGLFEIRDDAYRLNAQKTLRDAFTDEEVKGESAVAYADSWEAHMMSWINDAKLFYTDHLDALEESIKVVKGKPTTYSGDIAYINQGMGVWKKIEDRIGDYLEETVELMAKEASELDKAHALGKQIDQIMNDYLQKAIGAEDDYNYSAAEQERDRAVSPLESKRAEHQRKAQEYHVRRVWVIKQVKQLAAHRVFSSLSSSDRIEVPEVPAEAIKEAPETSVLVEQFEEQFLEALEEAYGYLEPADEEDAEPELPGKVEEASKRETLESKLTTFTKQRETLMQEMDTLSRKFQRLDFTEDALGDLRAEQFGRARAKYYGSVAKELKGRKTPELEKSFKNTLDEAVTARETLYQNPLGRVQLWPSKPLSDLGELEVQRLNQYYDRQIAKLKVIATRLGIDESDIKSDYIPPISRESGNVYRELVSRSKKAETIRWQMGLIKGQLKNLED